MKKKPELGTYPAYFNPYIQLVDGNVIKLLDQQREEIKHLLWYTEDLEYSYAPGKWSIRQIVQHLIDAERVFNYRAMCISRGENTSLPSFDQDKYANTDVSHVNRKQMWREYNSLRKSSIFLFKNMNKKMLDKKGNVGGNIQIARAIPFMIAGHQIHHINILKDKYGFSG